MSVIADVCNSEVSARRELAVHGSAPTLYKYLHCCFPEQTSDEAKKNVDGILFACPEESCTLTFLRYCSMQRHSGCGKHERALEHETLTNRAVMVKVYAEKLEGQPPSVPEVIANSRPDIVPNSCRKVAMGWALKAGAHERDLIRARMPISCCRI